MLILRREENWRTRRKTLEARERSTTTTLLAWVPRLRINTGLYPGSHSSSSKHRPTRLTFGARCIVKSNALTACAICVSPSPSPRPINPTHLPIPQNKLIKHYNSAPSPIIFRSGDASEYVGKSSKKSVFAKKVNKLWSMHQWLILKSYVITTKYKSNYFNMIWSHSSLSSIFNSFGLV